MRRRTHEHRCRREVHAPGARGGVRQRHRAWPAASAATRSTWARHYACPECFGPLEIAYDFPAVTREQIEAGPRNIWRYKALLPVPDDIEQSPNMEPGLHPAAQARRPPRRRRSASTTCGSRTTPTTRPTPSRTASSPCALSAARELGFTVLRLPVAPATSPTRSPPPAPGPASRPWCSSRATSSSAKIVNSAVYTENLRGRRRQLRRRQPARLRDRRRAGGLGVRQRQRPARTTPRAPRRSATRSPSSSAGGCPTQIVIPWRRARS